jgi:IS30 family transposase
MARLGRPGLTDAQKAELWERWRKGESLSDIGRAIGRHAGSVLGVLRLHGGIYQPPRKRSGRSLSLVEREDISRGIAAGHSIRAIAPSINRAPSTVCREVNRNRGRHRYRAADAYATAWDRACRAKRCKLATDSTDRRNTFIKSLCRCFEV